MKHTAKSLAVFLILVSLLASMLASCAIKGDVTKPGESGEVSSPKSAMTLEYSMENGKRVLTVSSKKPSTIYDGFLNQSGNEFIGYSNEFSKNDVEILRVGDGVVRIEKTNTLPGLETVEILNGEGLSIHQYAFFYNREIKNMIIGGKADKYQLGFVTQLDIGDKIAVIDMLGGQFNYTVERIDRAKTLDSEKLTSTDYSLTLFAYVAKEKKYVVVRCGA